MKLSTRLAMSCVTAVGLLGGWAATGAIVAHAGTPACGSGGCAWADVPDTDSTNGFYTPTKTVGGVTFACTADSDAPDGPCTLTLTGTGFVAITTCTAPATFTSTTVTLAMEGLTTTCVFTESTSGPVDWSAAGSSAGGIG